MTEEEDKKAWKDFTENGRNLKDHFGKIKKEAQNKKDYIKPKAYPAGSIINGYLLKYCIIIVFSVHNSSFGKPISKH